MSDYKNTLNLPQTDFPMKANLSQREPVILKKWEEINLYEQLKQLGQSRESFVLHAGPPYANGHIHMGTALNVTLKDIVTKSKTLSGYYAPLVPGWDCHGLPIELNVEKKVGKPNVKLSAAQFREACREYAEGFVNIQREEFKRLGVVADWQHPYKTMDFSYEANIIRSLATIMKNGHLEKGQRPVHWCLDCGSALAEAEVEYADKSSFSIDVKFAVSDIPALLMHFKTDQLIERIAVPIWTTTPWTLPANQAVALNPNLEYSLVITATHEALLIAASLVESVLTRYNMTDYQIVGTVLGNKLEGILLHHPFYPLQVPIVLGEHVTVEAGTGAVHTAPAHGEDDFVIGKKYKLPLDNPVGNDGCYISTVPLFAGQHVNKVNQVIIDLLEKNNVLLSVAKVTHSYPHCWRHKTPVIFRATPQWFIDFEKNNLREAALKAIKNVSWIPEWGQQRIYTMVESRPDWCISRQRTWGVPIPLFLHKETGHAHPDSIKFLEKIANDVEATGVEAWYELDPATLLGNEANNYVKSQDILDVWFDSGVSHECVLRHNSALHFPADLYLEGSDQHRGWFQSSLLSSMAMNNTAPYKTVLTHGYVIDIEGRKMSKSLGNVIAPEKIINSLGADILRLWVASSDYRTEINISDEILTRTSETYRRIRNTARFLLANLTGFNPQTDLIKSDEMLALDRWMVDRTRIMQEEIVKAYEAYQFHLIYQKIHQYCSQELGSFYLDIIKDRQYTTQTNSKARRSAQTALFHMTEAFVRWIAPILTFTAEEIWQYMPGTRAESVFLTTWYTELSELSEQQAMNASYWEKVRVVREAVNKELETQRNAGLIGSPLEAKVNLYCEPALKKLLDALEDELRFVLITSLAEVLPADDASARYAATDIPGLWLQVIPLDDAKCERCWHRRADIGKDPAHPGLCQRCVENVVGQGELRQYA